MPISMQEFIKLPKVALGTRKGGKKVDWNAVQSDIAGHGAFTVKEVYGLATKHALGKLEIDPITKQPLPAISKFRTQRWLNQQVEKGLMECKTTEKGDYVYAVSVIGKIDTPKPSVVPAVVK